MVIVLMLAASGAMAWADDLVVVAGDLRIEQRNDAGYHLFIKARPGLGSVLLVESTKDPAGAADNYAYRAETWNEVNGDEQRLLNGAFIPAASKIYSLVDSSPEPDAQFGSAFHIFIPWVVAYGYSWSRNGREFIADGTFVNIRAFAKPYADYTGPYHDNPYRISVTQKPFPRPEPVVAPPVVPPKPEEPKVEPKVEPPDMSMYMPETLKAFESIAASGRGRVSYSTGQSDIVPVLGSILDGISGDELDLVLCLDTTDSMSDDIDAVKATLPPMIKEKTARFASFRLGLVLYKDYFEDYVVKHVDFTRDIAAFTAAVSRIRVAGGRDIPEAVYEALYEGLTGYDWSAKNRMIILIGDAPPHPIPRGKIDKSMVDARSAELGVAVNIIILPH